jgi:hypothetical protein
LREPLSGFLHAKFTDAGEVAIKAEANNGAFHLSVRDTGPGKSECDVGKNLLICVKADLFERVHTVNVQQKGERMTEPTSS